MENRRFHLEQCMWAAQFRPDLWIYSEFLGSPKPACNSNAAVFVASKRVGKLEPEDPGASQAALRSAERARHLAGAGPSPKDGGLRVQVSQNRLSSNYQEESCAPKGPARTSYSCFHQLAGDSVCLFVFNVKLISLSCSRWFLF